MAHGAPEKRRPGLVGDAVDGVGTVVSDAVGVVTTVVSDVVGLVSPQRATAATTRPASTTTATGGGGGGGGSSSVQATATATSPSPNAATSSPSGETTGGGSSGNDDNNNGGGGGSSDGSGSSSGNSDSGSTSDSDSGSGSGSGDTGSSQVTGASSINASGASGASLTTTGTGTNTALGSASSGSAASRSGTGVVNLVEATSLGASGSSANPSAVLNAANSLESDSVSGGSRVSGTLQNSATQSGTSHRSSTTTSSSGSGSGGDDGSVNGHSASSANGSGALSPGAIAGIVIACSLVLIFLIVFVLRKCYRKRRARRFEHWVSRPGAFSFFGGAAVSVNSEKERSIDGGRSGSGAGSGSGTRSARSSFGTSYDVGLRPMTPDSFFHASSPASMSEIHASANTPTSFLTGPVMPPPVARSVEHTGSAGSRQSLISLGTSSASSYDTDGAAIARSLSHENTSTEAVAEEVNGSADQHAQYLLTPRPRERGSAQLSPISVRPWSPSERWAFPKPPQTAEQSTVYSTTPAPRSQSAHVEQMSASSYVPLSAVTTPTAEQDPFADAALATTALRRASDVSAATDSAVTAHTSGSAADELSGAVEQIRRPFVPTLADELRVNRGDVVRVLQVFDDGWVQVEILSRANSSSVIDGASSGSAPGLERGLIPVDCLREAGEALPTFLASRRVSSYYGGIAI